MKRLLLALCFPLTCLAGSWTDLGTGTLFTNVRYANQGSGGAGSAVSSVNYNFFSQFQNRINAWSGGDVYSNGTKFFIFGGGDGDYAGNEITSVDLLGRTIANIYSYSCFNYISGSSPCALSGLNDEALPDGSMSTRHTYQGLACVDRHNTCYQFSGGKWGSGIGRFMWEYPMNGTTATNWTMTTQFSLGAGAPNTINCKDYVAADKLYCFGGSGGPSYLFAYDYNAHTWSQLSGGIPSAPAAMQGAMMTVDNTRNIAIFAGNKNDPATTSVGILGWVDLTGSDSYTFHDVTSVADPTCHNWIIGSYPGIAFDPNDNMVVGKAQEGSTVYVLNPQTWSCKTDNPSGGPANNNTIPQTSGSHGLFGRFAYSVALNGFVTLNAYDQNVFVYKRTYGLGSSFINSSGACVDMDGDTYGVGPGCTGLDADDTDSAVHTSAAAITKWGSLKNFILHLGYNPGNFWYLSPTGNDANTCHDTNASSAITNPCATYSHIKPFLTTGDLVFWRAGTYTENLAGFPMASGSTYNPMVYMAYPAEAASIKFGTNVQDTNWATIDGLDTTCPTGFGIGWAGGSTYGGTAFHDVTFKHLSVHACQAGITAYNGMNHILLENNVVYDESILSSGHGFYLGSREEVSQNITVRGNISYKSSLNGMQFNGRVTNLVVEQNMFYSNLGSGLSLENGVSSSFIRSNQFFNNGTAGITVALYDYNGVAQCGVLGSTVCDCSQPPSSLSVIGYCPWDQTNNTVENNTFYQTGKDYTGATTTYGAIAINNQDYNFPRSLNGFVFRNNIFYGGTDSTHPPLFQYWNENGVQREVTPVAELAWWATWTFDHNIMLPLPAASSSNINTFFDRFAGGNTTYTCANLNTITTVTTCTNSDPLFTAASTTYYNSPQSFNFLPATGSPAINAGSATLVSPSDIFGTHRNQTNPTLGAQELSGCLISPTTFGPYTKNTSIGTVTLTASNCGAGTLTWTSSGLPAGVSGCNSVTGVTCTLTGTPTTVTTYTPTISVSDGGSNSNTIGPSIIVNDVPVITTTTLPSIMSGNSYSQSLSTTGGTAPLTFTISSGTLSGSGLTLNSNGTITGTAATAATYTFTPVATDVNGKASVSNPSLSILVTPILSFKVSIGDTQIIRPSTSIRN